MIVFCFMLITSVGVILLSPLNSALADSLCFTEVTEVQQESTEQEGMHITVGNSVIETGEKPASPAESPTQEPERVQEDGDLDAILASSDPDKFVNAADRIARKLGRL